MDFNSILFITVASSYLDHNSFIVDTLPYSYCSKVKAAEIKKATNTAVVGCIASFASYFLNSSEATAMSMERLLNT